MNYSTLTAILLSFALTAAAQESPPPSVPSVPAVPPVPARKNAAPNREQVRQKILERFDKDGDGTLNADERKAAEAEREAKLIERFDADGDGTLSATERAAARGPLNKQGPGAKKPGVPSRPLRDKILKKFDTDGDGTLSETERAAAKKARQQRAKKNPA